MVAGLLMGSYLIVILLSGNGFQLLHVKQSVPDKDMKSSPTRNFVEF